MDQKSMKAHKVYLLTKAAIFYDQESYFVPYWDGVSSNHQKEYFLRKLISNVKSNRITLMKS